MKRFIMAIVCLMTMVLSAKAQTISSYQESANDSVYVLTDSTVTLAGYYLKKSAIYDAASLGCIGLGGLVAMAGGFCEKDCDKDACLVAAGALGVASLVCQVFKVKYKWKSGKCLELYGNGIRVTF